MFVTHEPQGLTRRLVAVASDEKIQPFSVLVGYIPARP